MNPKTPTATHKSAGNEPQFRNKNRIFDRFAENYTQSAHNHSMMISRSIRPKPTNPKRNTAHNPIV
jgi:hypothetical protein